MKNLKIIFILLSFLSFTSSCGDFRKVMTGDKIENTDEFLVKKKDPLILPPKYYELPVPNSEGNASKDSSIESILSSSETSSGNPKNKSDLENMILKELRKKN